jgi:hypothetical protein
MPKTILLLALLAACAAREAPPMAGACVDRVAPNLFSERDESVPFRECKWQGRTWVCRLERDANAWRCVAVGQAN